MKPEGTLYFAAENAAGVRYWMGAERFDVSFLRAEVLELLESLEGTYGGSSLLYYPVPDYRYPAAVYSDAYLPENGEVTNISARLDGPGLTSEARSRPWPWHAGTEYFPALPIRSWERTGEDSHETDHICEI